MDITTCLGIGRFTDHQLLVSTVSGDFETRRLEIVDLSEVNDMESLLKSIAMVCLMRHENLLAFHVVQRSDTLLIVCPDYLCDCEQMIKEVQGVGVAELQINWILFFVVRALAYLHSQYIIHRRLRPSSICIGFNGHVYLRDLEDSIVQMDSQKVLHEMYEPLDCSDKTLLPYISPDVLLQGGLGYTMSSDLYSISVVACELANGFPLFSPHLTPLQILYEKTVGIRTPLLWDRTMLAKLSTRGACYSDEPFRFQKLKRAAGSRKFSSAFHQFVKKCFAANRSCTALDLVNHSFLTRWSFGRAGIRTAVSSLAERVRMQCSHLCTQTACPIATRNPRDLTISPADK